MRFIFFAMLVLYSAMSGCSTVNIGIRLTPEHTGIDLKAQPIVDEYMRLSAENNIRFYNKITLGFKNINSGAVVGLCHFGPTFREIDLDISYWNYSSYTAKMVLVFHELTHCMCNRGHDYAEGSRYPVTETEKITDLLRWKMGGGNKPGHMADGCPLSLMYPVVVDSACMRAHYSEYVKEMFDRCRPW